MSLAETYDFLPVDYDANPLALEEDQSTALTPLEFSLFSIKIKGKPLDLSVRPWLWDIYNLAQSPTLMPNGEERLRRKAFLVFGRQCEKSTTVGNTLLTYTNLIPYFRALYVTSSDIQMREFSDERLRAVIQDSDVLQWMTGKGTNFDTETQNVQTKRWINQSKIMLRSVHRNADRCRGIAADGLAVDEIQDIYTDDLPVIEETLFNCNLEEGPLSIYSGTPKSFDNPLENYWGQHSTMNEWLTKCEGCNKWNLIESKHVSPKGLLCERCGKELNPLHGEWVATGPAAAEWEGYRVPQPVVLYAYKNRPVLFRNKWESLMFKFERYSDAKRENEVMARSHDSGSKPVTYQDVRACSLTDVGFYPEMPPRTIQSNPCWAGVDWGTGGGEGYTVLSIWGYDAHQRFQLLYGKIYEGREADPDYAVAHMIKVMKNYKVSLIGADRGYGYGLYDRLLKAFGADKVLIFQHGGPQAQAVQMNKQGMYFTTHRTAVMRYCFDLIRKGPKTGGVVLPQWDQVKPFADHILAVTQHYSERSRQIIYNHPRGRPDDFLQTFVYAFLASLAMHRRPDITQPGVNGKKKGS